MIARSLSTLALVLLMLMMFVVSVVVKPHWYQSLFERLSWRTSGLVLDVGDVQSSWNPVRFQIRDLHLSNPHWPRPELLSIEQLDLTLTDMPDLAAPFWALSASGIELSVEQDREGRFNWLSRFGQSASTTEGDTAPTEPVGDPVTAPFSLPGDFNFHSVDIQDWTVRWRIGGEQGEAALPRIRLNREAQAQSRLTIDARYREQNINIVGAAELEPASGDRHSRVKLDLTLNQAAISVSGDGQIVLSPNLAGTAFDLAVNAPQLDTLGQLLQTEMPALENISMTGRFVIDEQWHLKQLQLAANEQKLNGELHFLPQELRLSGRLNSESLNLNRLLPTNSDTDPEELAPETELDLRILQDYPMNLAITAGELRYQDWLIDDLKLQLQNEDQLLVGMELAQFSDPTGMQTGAVSAELRIKAREPIAKGPDLDLQLNASIAEQKLAVAGPVNVNGVGGTRLKLSIDGERSLPLWQLLQQPYQEAGALRVRGDIQLDGEQSGEAELKVSLGGSSLLNQTQWQAPSGRLQVRSSLKADKLDLRFTESGGNASAGKTEQTAQSEASGPLFSDESIDFSSLRSVDAELDIELKQLISESMQVQSLTAQPTLRRGMLSMDRARIDLTQGSAILSTLLNARNDEALLRLDMDIQRVPVSVLGIDPSVLGDSGEVNAVARLSSSGSSPKQLAAGLAGSVEFQAQDIVVKNNKIDLVGGDIFSETLGKLNPFAKSDPNTYFDCISLALDGRAGRFESDKKLVLETRKMKIIGAGEIDLAKERLSIGMTPIARKGLGVSAGSLVQMVKLAGPLTDPRVVADASGVLNAGLSTSAAVYTGGLSLIAQGLIKRAMNSGSACKNGGEEPMELELPDYMQQAEDAETAEPAQQSQPEESAVTAQNASSADQ